MADILSTSEIENTVIKSLHLSLTMTIYLKMK